ncbi:MAG: hypothetical protein ABIH76_03920 [Candidatus Bathyarchaeota archaeon]
MSKLKRSLTFKPIALEGYSMTRMLLFGLILPAIIAFCMFVSYFISILFAFQPLVTMIIVLASSLAGFTWGTVLLFRYSGKIMKYVEVKKK